MSRPPRDPDWTAPRVGHDWCDEDLLRVTNWLRSFVPAEEMVRRIDAARSHLLRARQQWQEGNLASLYDPSDAIAWYVFQAETYAVDRMYWVPDQAARIVPFLTRLGRDLDLLRTASGVEQRAARLMTRDRKQPDGGIFELLVSLAYRRHGWRVEFVPERPGVERTPDLNVYKPRRRWAVECKRLAPSSYAIQERLRGTALAKRVHALSLTVGLSLIVEVKFNTELKNIQEDYLEQHVDSALKHRRSAWSDKIAEGRIRHIDWSLPRRILTKDYVYFGSSRMIELLSGYYVDAADHSMAAKWRPAPNRPFYADAVYQASVVSWLNLSEESIEQKSRHFRSTVARAEAQLPHDRPGVIHVGVESGMASDIAANRHFKNYLQARMFEPTVSHLRWVYGNYFVPELTTHQNESWALTETTVPYRIGRHRVPLPLAGHFLVMPEGEARDGVHWDGRD